MHVARPEAAYLSSLPVPSSSLFAEVSAHASNSQQDTMCLLSGCVSWLHIYVYNAAVYHAYVSQHLCMPTECVSTQHHLGQHLTCQTMQAQPTV